MGFSYHFKIFTIIVRRVTVETIKIDLHHTGPQSLLWLAVAVNSAPITDNELQTRLVAIKDVRCKVFQSLLQRLNLPQSKPELLSLALSSADPDLLRTALTNADPQLLKVNVDRAKKNETNKNRWLSLLLRPSFSRRFFHWEFVEVFSGHQMQMEMQMRKTKIINEVTTNKRNSTNKSDIIRLLHRLFYLHFCTSHKKRFRRNIAGRL